MSLKNRNYTKRIVIHHSASPPDTTMEQVDQWHRNRGFTKIGYHYFLESDGTVKIGRPDWAVGAHAIGANFDSLGICLAGNFEEAPPTQAQMKALAELIKDDIRKAYGNIPYIGHKDVDPKGHPTACPGKLFPWEELEKLLGYKEVDSMTVDEALKVLEEQGITSSPAYWKNAAECVKYLDALIVNMAKKLQGGK